MCIVPYVDYTKYSEMFPRPVTPDSEIPGLDRCGCFCSFSSFLLNKSSLLTDMYSDPALQPIDRTESSPIDGAEVCRNVKEQFNENSRVSPDLQLPYKGKEVIKEGEWSKDRLT